MPIHGIPGMPRMANFIFSSSIFGKILGKVELKLEILNGELF